LRCLCCRQRTLLSRRGAPNRALVEQSRAIAMDAGRQKYWDQIRMALT
jgi:hypothetical protein